MQNATYACEVCGHLFTTDQELREHLLAVHELEPPDEDSLYPEDEETAA
ncbi:MAG TPA: hypothetical protein VGF06_11940 [Terriglobales bacterium]|jgi:hypothetical protein